MKCDKDYDLVGFLNNEGTKEERAEINSHIAECSDCLRELAEIRAAFQSVKAMPQIEPPGDFTRRVLEAVRQSMPVPARLNDAVGQAGQGTLLDILWYYLKRSPPWAVSTAIHAVIFALLAFVFVSQTYKKPPVPEGFYTCIVLPKEDGSVTPIETVTDPIESASVPDMPGRPETIGTPCLAGRQALRLRKELVAKLRKGENKIASNLLKRADKQAREELLAKNGGKGTEEAVANGMKWLASAQEPAGNWTPSKYGGRDEYTAGLTGLAMLCYTAQGNSHLNGEYSQNVDKSVRYLISIQQANGLIDSRPLVRSAEAEARRGRGSPLAAAGNTRVPASVLHNHGIATYALLEDYLLASDYAESNQSADLLSELLEDALGKAIGFIIKAQSANGGWGYEARSKTPDTSVTVWQIQVLRLASVLDISGVEDALFKSRQWLNEVTADNGLVGFQARLDYPNGPDGLTAAGLNAYLLIDSLPAMNAVSDVIKKRLDGLVSEQLAHIVTKEPMALLMIGEDGGHRTETYLNYDLYYWYWAGPDLMGSSEWDNPPDRRMGFGWNTSLKRSVLMGQTKEGKWQVEDQWSIYGGELYTTSMAILCLQVYYRNPPLRAN
ncbi:MAG: hypothetical protein AB1599_03685 [Planctomycetota bacterium]